MDKQTALKSTKYYSTMYHVVCSIRGRLHETRYEFYSDIKFKNTEG